MHRRAGPEPDSTNAALPQRKIPPAPFYAPAPTGAIIQSSPTLLGPPYPSVMPEPHIRVSPMIPVMCPPPEMMPKGTAPGIRSRLGGHMHIMPGSRVETSVSVL